MKKSIVHTGNACTCATTKGPQRELESHDDEGTHAQWRVSGGGVVGGQDNARTHALRGEHTYPREHKLTQAHTYARRELTHADPPRTHTHRKNTPRGGNAHMHRIHSKAANATWRKSWSTHEHVNAHDIHRHTRTSIRRETYAHEAAKKNDKNTML